MKIRAQIQTWLLTALLIGEGCLMAGCSDHADDEQNRQDEQKSVPFTIASLTRSGDETTETALSTYDGLSIQLFLVPQDNNIAGTETLKGQAVYTGEGLPWMTTIGVKESAKYKVFGFMPAGISANDGYNVTIISNKAILNIPQMLTVSNKDVCVITGVKDHPLDTDIDEKVLPGVFDYTANSVSGQGYGVSLLAEHIYSAVEIWFKMKANVAYNDLRTIKLKQVLLKNTQMAVVNATIPLTMGTSETSVPKPVREITMEKVESTVVAETTLFSSDAGQELETADGSEIKVPGYFTLGNNDTSELVIESVYDVYDKDVYDKDVLVRENCHAVNKINDLVGSLERGDKKIIKITVNPTYLYVLTDDDSGNIGLATTTTGD
jgi:hypothetical protein